MSQKNKRELTPLEYVVLGLIGHHPQSGYDIINYFSPAGVYSWSASPGSIYPILKRLEQQGIIDGKLEMEKEMRPRKIYSLSELGEEILDAWLREIPKPLPLYEQRELAIWRFQFMEGRLKLAEVIRWIDGYLEALRTYDYGRKIYHEGTLAAMKEYGQDTVHRQLLLEVALMEFNTMRTWLEMARARLTAIGRATGEFTAIEGE
jgi:DNA-binding PadR family transcriptional regulator